MIQRESMEFDIVIVGGGPAGLATACRIRQFCLQQDLDFSVCVIEKGSEIGAHILSGAIIESNALDELFPNWQELDAPLTTPVTEEALHFLATANKAFKLPNFLLPKAVHNQGNYVASLGNLCRWLAEQAENLGVEIFAGFAAAEILYDENQKVLGVATGDLGLNSQGEQKASFEAGYDLLGKYTVFAEGCRGHLGKQLIKLFKLDEGKMPQHYGLGIKELWEINPDKHQAGKVVHGLGWPLGFGSSTTGGSFLYHLDNSQVVVGLITDLNYENPWLSPFDEFQQMKHHPLFKDVLSGGKRVAYGARALTKGGIQSLPKLVFPGGILVGDEAGFLNFLKIKGSHTAIQSGILAADNLVQALSSDTPPATLDSYQSAFEKSALQQELHTARNSAPAFHKFGTLLGSVFNFFDQCLFRGKLPFTLQDATADHSTLKSVERSKKLTYPLPDNELSFDKLSSVFLSNTNHEEDQPCHLKLADPATPIEFNLPEFDEPAQRYCPAGVYEVLRSEVGAEFQINAQNCVHCKTCDIKDPCQNITWVNPEGGGGPNYPNM